jgi:hypothetical protein
MLIKKNVPLLQNARIQKYLYNSEFSFLIILLKFSIRELRNEKKVELILISHFIFIIFNFKKSDFGMAGMSTDKGAPSDKPYWHRLLRESSEFDSERM